MAPPDRLVGGGIRFSTCPLVVLPPVRPFVRPLPNLWRRYSINQSMRLIQTTKIHRKKTQNTDTRESNTHTENEWTDFDGNWHKRSTGQRHETINFGVRMLMFKVVDTRWVDILTVTWSQDCLSVCIESVCLAVYVANGHIMSFSLPSLKPLIDNDFLPFPDIRSVTLYIYMASSVTVRLFSSCLVCLVYYCRRESIRGVGRNWWRGCFYFPSLSPSLPSPFPLPLPLLPSPFPSLPLLSPPLRSRAP